MIDLNTIVKKTLKKYGDKAAEHFGVSAGTLKSYTKRGHFPLKFVDKVIADPVAQQIAMAGATAPPDAPETVSGIPEAYRQPQPEMTTTVAAPMDQRMYQVEDYLRNTVDFYIRQYANRIAVLEAQVQQLQGYVGHLSRGHLRDAGVGGSLVDPSRGSIAGPMFTTNPNGGMAPLDSGIAPTKAMVDAQAGMTFIGGVHVPNARPAGPAEAVPQAAFGFGWNQPKPSR